MSQDHERTHPPDESAGEAPEGREDERLKAESPDARGWRWAVPALVLAIAVGLAGRWFLSPRCEGEGCPSVDELASYRPPEPPQIFDASGELAGQLSGPRRTVVELDSIPEIVRDGYVAVEDRRFWDHEGVDFRGGFRAFFANIASGGIAEGASTITMQLARNVFGPDVLEWNRFRRKLAEIRLARRIEDQLTKDEILALYLNQIYLGDGVYGVATAAEHYFGKPVSQVGTREAALLIGLAKNPEGYNPRRDPYAARDRIEIVLDLLVREGVITAEEAAEAKEQRVQLVENPDAKEWGKNAYYLSAVRRELRELIPDPVARQGMRVHSGLDQRAQAAATDALVEQIQAIERDRWGAFRGEAAGDLSRTEGAASPYLQGMVVAMDPETGLVTTVVGGRDYEHSEFDRAFQALRQPGSAFKPIVYAAALSSGLRLTDRISTEPVRMASRGSADWQPSDHVSGQELSVRDALVFSSNTAAVRVGQRLGPEQVAEQAHRMGISSEIPNYPSIYLGAGDVVPAELVAAYALFTNGGHTIEPHFITRIEDHEGRVLYRRDPRAGSRVLDPGVAFLVLDMMRDVVRRGTGWRVSSAGMPYPVAGKTGTTNDSKDAWFIGMSPRLVAGVWLGFDEPRTIVRGAGGGELAAPVWASFMAVANRGLGAMPAWRPPPGVIQVQIDPRTGYRVTESCPAAEARTEYFLQGTEPFEYCPYRTPLYGDSWYSSSDTFAVQRLDSLDAAYGEPGRTIFFRGDDDDEDEEEREERRVRQQEERERRLDSLIQLRRERRPAYPEPRDTVRMRTDTTRATPDTIWPTPDTIRPTRDTVVRPDTTGRGAGRGDTVRGPGG